MISDIRNLDLNLPKALDALLDERSVTHAAARLFLTLTVVSDMVAVVLSRPGKMADGMRITAPPRAMSGFTKSMVWHERNHRDPAQQQRRELLFKTNPQK